MKCARCGANLSGYVELGSEGYQRVKAGRCPNCGAGMPKGVNVGFSKSRQDLNPRVSQQDVLDSYRTTGKHLYPTVYLSFIGGLGIFLCGGVWWSALLGVLFWLLFAFVGWAYYGEINLFPYYGQNSYRESDKRSSTLFVVVLLVSPFLFLTGLGIALARDGFVAFYWLFGILADFLISSIVIRIFKKIL